MSEHRDVLDSDISALKGSFSHDIPACRIPDAMMFGYPTRLVDSWTPAPERIMLPGYLEPERRFRFRLRDGMTYRPFALGQDARPLAQGEDPDRLARRLPVHRAAGTVLCDSRPLYEWNLSHLTYEIIPRVLLCRELMREHTGQDVPVTVVFRKHADTLARRFMDYLHIPAIYTDVHVQGTIIDPDRGSIYGSIVLCEPKLFDFPIDDYDPSTPE